MHVPSLHWFRSKQRTVARFVLAAFCLTWLQIAAMPCVMATGAVADAPAMMQASAPPRAAMPDGMVMAPGEHCMYCPPPGAQSPADHSLEQCAFPHDPQVDSRAAFASILLAPPPVVVQLVPHDAGSATEASHPVSAAPRQAGPSLAVSYCRFLK